MTRRIFFVQASKNFTFLSNKISVSILKQGARQQTRMQDLQAHIDRINREKMALESTVSSYKNEVVSLRGDMTKLQVSDDRRLHSVTACMTSDFSFDCNR